MSTCEAQKDPLDFILPGTGMGVQDESQEAPLTNNDIEVIDGYDVFNRLGDCGRWSTVGSCRGDDHHQVAKSLDCGLEWCPQCGRKGSAVHLQRIARQAVKILSSRRTGYTVFTIPAHIRHRFMMPRSLSDLRRYVNRMLRRELGQIHGFARYHFVGDCKFKCGGKDPDCVCGATGLNSEVWHPHLNVVHDHGWIDDIDLDRIKALYQQWLEDYTDTFIPAISVHNTYRNGFDDKILQHKLWRYVGYSLRPTFTKEALDNWSAATGLDGARTWTGWLNTVELGQYPEGEWVPPVHKFRPPVEDVIKRRKGDVVVRATHWFRLHLAGEPTIIDPRVRKFLQRKKVLWALITGQRENKCPTCGARVDWEFMAETRKRWKECKGIFRIDVHEYRNAQAFHCVWLQ